MDSDSDSDGESQQFVETQTLLGWPTKEPTGDSTKLGGLPEWIDGKTAPSATLAKCKICNDFMSLLLQVNGDMPERFPGHERRLYVFGCRRKTCRRKDGSIRGFRGSRFTKTAAPEKKAAPKQEPAKPAIDIGSTLFGSKAAGSTGSSNPFLTNPQSTMTNPFSAMSSMASKPAQRVESLPETFASKVKISDDVTSKPQATPSPHEPWPIAEKMSPPYPEFYLDAEYETLSAPPTPQMPTVMPDMDEGEGSSGGGVEDKTLYESTMDKAFQKFADRIENNPEQAIRYEYGGAPLLYSDTDAVGKLLSGGGQKSSGKISVQASTGSKAPRCPNCGAGRVFEVQLVPHAITVLEEDEMSIDGMEWGTIMMFVCEKDCTPHGTGEKQLGYAEEFVAVQWEELAGKGR